MTTENHTTKEPDDQQPAVKGLDGAACSLPIVSLEESTAPKDSGNFDCLTVKLTEGREVLVGQMKNGKRMIRIRRPEPAGGICETKFSMSEDAAYALGWLLSQSFKRMPYEGENDKIHP